MSITSEERAWRGRLGELTNREQLAYQAVFDQVHRFGISAADNERKAHLEAAVVRYLIESRDSTTP